ncbi:carcinoembryonic antigen-related cell adhesion molecule 21-like [Artibeus jamaicensis]|uniref:carcinoembryonic antigen-related cell adhesion molecule 21-like n=1 Tax=Artibeus jamaicensis TaxID=9417 RepID=UPI00235ACD2B|nr:carcinoembryonic antigen-related cell adhesion molecule 21-like [Artibeus jamaicensis]
MGSLSVSTHRGLVHWQGLLVAVSLLTFWCQPTTAQLAIVSTYAAEGKDVILHIRNKPPNSEGFMWFKGEGAKYKRILEYYERSIRRNIKGPASSGREEINFDGSLLIKKVSKTDAGMYTIVIFLQDSKKEIGFGRLTVYEPVIRATLVASNTTVTENKDTVVFTCNTNGLFIDWLFNGMKLHLRDRMKVSADHQRLTIDPVKREDAGIYQCEVSNPIMSTESCPLKLNVKFK